MARRYKAGVSVRTAYRRLADPMFRQQLDGVRADMVRRSSAMLTAASMEAIKTLVSLQSLSTPAAVRLGAAKAVLDLGMKLREGAELEQRITSLEAQLRPGAAGDHR